LFYRKLEFMSVKKKKKKHISLKPVKEFISRNKMAAGISVGVVFIIAVAAIAAVLFWGEETEEAVEDTAGIAEETIVTETSVDDSLVLLELDAYPAVNELMKRYYDAVTVGDRNAVMELTDITDDKSLIYMEMRSNFIEGYNDLKCYTKVGPIENSYVVYVAYNVKFIGIERQVPGVSPFLIYPDEAGNLYIHEGEVSDEVNAYLEQISSQDDVVDLMNAVQVEFNDTILQDEGLSNFLAEMKEELQVAVGDALAVLEEAKASGQVNVQPAAVMFDAGTKVEVTAVVNVRASDSEQADKLGKLQIGDEYSVIESRQNGWTKISFEGKDAFVKSEFLTAAKADTENAQENEAQASDTDNGLPSKGTIKVGATVNVRKSASETAEKIGVCYQGEKLEILMQQADGWTKVKFEGKTGYVKTSVLEELD